MYKYIRIYSDSDSDGWLIYPESFLTAKACSYLFANMIPSCQRMCTRPRIARVPVLPAKAHKEFLSRRRCWSHASPCHSKSGRHQESGLLARPMCSSHLIARWNQIWLHQPMAAQEALASRHMRHTYASADSSGARWQRRRIASMLR